MATPFPAGGTDAEKRAWADAQTAPASPGAAVAPVASTPAPGSVEAQVNEVTSRQGGYLKAQATDHMNKR